MLRSGRRAQEERPWLNAIGASLALLVLPIAGWLLLARDPRTARNIAEPASLGAADAPARPARTAPSTGRATRPAATAMASPTAGVEGEVVGPDDKPIDGADVHCLLGDRELASTTDEEGHFQFAADAAGCKAVAKKRGFAASAEATLSAAGGNRLRLGPGTGIAGVVVDESGAPVSMYSIGVESFERQASDEGEVARPPALRVNDASGTFLLDDLPPGRYVLAVSAVGFPLTQGAPVEVAAGQVMRDVRITLKRGATVTGTVIDAKTRAPLSGVMVYAETNTKSGILNIPTVTMPPRGEFTIEGMCPETCNLRAFVPGYAEKVVPGVRVPASGEPVNVEIALDLVTVR